MAQVFIGLGSNLGDGRKNLCRAWQRMGRVQGVTLKALSDPYLTEPVNMESPHWFTNAVGLLVTSLYPERLLHEMLEVERELGRIRAISRDRTVDLDLLYYDDLVIRAPGLIVPHPEIERRLFVLAPLEDLASGYRHPILCKTTREMREQLAGLGPAVKKIVWHNNMTSGT